ncbi:aldo/keto reductase [Winkia neuii]|uniref:aldo/keto reductase n=1 Tax=Winkia neuii TaxID=33007 RepID=UPI001E29E9F3|nr:aldo/keto reductase [Winkia neuii]
MGTLTWGRDTDTTDAGACYDLFREAGGTFIDTAPNYGQGLAEQTLAPLLTKDRDEVVLATKVGVNAGHVDASRRAILTSLDASLKSLHTDHVDLLLVQSWDRQVPTQETLDALAHAVFQGKTCYVGWCNLDAWQLTYLQASSPIPLVALENEYSLLNREVEQATQALDFIGTSLLAWAPLGRGVLTGKYSSSTPPDSRAASTHLSGYVAPYLNETSARKVDAVLTAANGLERSASEVALAWVRDRPQVATAIIGARTPAQLQVDLRADSLTLPSQIERALADATSLL